MAYRHSERSEPVLELDSPVVDVLASEEVEVAEPEVLSTEPEDASALALDRVVDVVVSAADVDEFDDEPDPLWATVNRGLSRTHAGTSTRAAMTASLLTPQVSGGNATVGTELYFTGDLG